MAYSVFIPLTSYDKVAPLSEETYSLLFSGLAVSAPMNHLVAAVPLISVQEAFSSSSSKSQV